MAKKIIKIGPYLFPSNRNFENVQYLAAFESSTSLLVYFLFSVSNVAMARGAKRKSITDALRFMGKMASGKWLKQHTMLKYTAIPRYYTAYLCERNIVIGITIDKQANVKVWFDIYGTKNNYLSLIG